MNKQIKRNNLKRALALLSSSCLLLGGCGSYVNDNVENYQTASMMTTQEVVDYYATSLSYDNVITKNVTKHETTYVTQDIQGSKEEKLKSLTAQAEAILGADEYEYSEENLKVVSPDTYHYIKCTLDDSVLTNSTILNITGALGYYFVDVKYDLSSKSPGKFKATASLLGLDGVWLTQYDGTYKVDLGFMVNVVNSLNEYYYDNGIKKCAMYNDMTKEFEILDGVDPDLTGATIIYEDGTTAASAGMKDNEDFTQQYTEPTVVENTVNENAETGDNNTDTVDNETGENIEDNTTTEDTESTENTETEEETTSEESTETETESTSHEYKTTSDNSIVSSERKIQFDVTLVNRVAGSSLTQKAFLPSLDEVYEKPEKEGTISGYGIYPSGINGLKVFGFNRSNITGDITLRYVFKDDAAASGDIIGTNIYITEENVNTGTNISDTGVMIPEFLETQFEQLIERADRVQANIDLTGMMNSNIYEDLGYAVLAGYKNNYCRTLKYMSAVRQVISRDTENNTYLLDIETTVSEGPRSVDCFGTYRDKYYIVVQQQGDKFVISDSVRVSREMVEEPPINPDSAITKRLVALNLAGEIEEDTKKEILVLMSDLYTAGTYRKLNVEYDDQGEPLPTTVNGQEITLNRGMYQCFDQDASMLSSDKMEYMNSELRNILIKYGATTPSVYSGTVTRWIGGYENQAEFTTEELVTYSGTNTGYYMEVYYLVSNMNDQWVIDERTVIDEYEVTNESELQSIKERVGQ